MAAVHEFFRNEHLLKDFNATIIALVPKNLEACVLSDYRPISCCNVIYKVISKIVANMIKSLISDCISPNQSAFLKGRALGDNVLLASEHIRKYESQVCSKSCMLKVNLRKAFDTVSWDFLLKLL